MGKTVLVIAAHPDDEVLGCGGTIANHVMQGDKVCCLVLGEGLRAREGTRGTELDRLKEEARDAARILGTAEVLFRDFPDNKFDAIPLLDIVRVIERVKSEVRPEVIYTHHRGDLNIDHRITFDATMTACRPLQNETVREIYAFECPSSTEWNSPDVEMVFLPNMFVNISGTLTQKIEALKAYRTEIREYPHPRSARGLEIIARRWGLVVGLEFVEAFSQVRRIVA